MRGRPASWRKSASTALHSFPGHWLVPSKQPFGIAEETTNVCSDECTGIRRYRSSRKYSYADGEHGGLRSAGCVWCRAAGQTHCAPPSSSRISSQQGKMSHGSTRGRLSQRSADGRSAGKRVLLQVSPAFLSHLLKSRKAGSSRWDPRFLEPSVFTRVAARPFSE